MKTLRQTLIIAALSISPPASFCAESDDIHGWGRFRFGMSVPEVRSAAPDAEMLSPYSYLIDLRRLHGLEFDVGLLFSQSGKDLQVIILRMKNIAERRKLSHEFADKFAARVSSEYTLPTKVTKLLGVEQFSKQCVEIEKTGGNKDLGWVPYAWQKEIRIDGKSGQLVIVSSKRELCPNAPSAAKDWAMTKGIYSGKFEPIIVLTYSGPKYNFDSDRLR
jgi:hypothetical protein